MRQDKLLFRAAKLADHFANALFVVRKWQQGDTRVLEPLRLPPVEA
jgi:hypothetical protein